MKKGRKRGTDSLIDIRACLPTSRPTVRTPSVADCPTLLSMCPTYRLHQRGKDTSSGIDRHRTHAIMSETTIYFPDNSHRMNVTHPIAEKVLTRLRSGQGAAVPAGDFLDLGQRAAVDQALSRLTRQGAIRRVRRGLYELPRIGKLLNEPIVQSPDELVQAWARNNGLRVVPSGRTLRICSASRPRCRQSSSTTPMAARGR